MKRLLLYILFFPAISSAQNEANNWFYGHHAGITFNTGNPSALPGGQTQTNEGTSSISDAAGNLLFYSDGVKVWNRNHLVMPNGTGLHGNESSSQSCLIVPWPEQENLYFVFTAPDYSTGYGLEYSVVDMTLDGGFGDVTSVKNIVLLSSSTEKLTAALHSNGRDVWVVGHSFESADFYAWQVSAGGINTVPVISSAGTIHQSYPSDWNSHQNKIGTMKISPCGNQLACAVLYDSFAELFDFNDSSGVVSNALYLGTLPDVFPYGIYGVEFSPACSKLYVSSTNPAFVVQFDLTVPTASAILASADTVISSSSEYYGTLQNGPDGKTYLSRAGQNYLGCITQPDLAGNACQYVSNYVNAGNSATAIYGLPNFIVNWFHITATQVEEVFADDAIAISSNPASDMLTVHITFPDATIQMSDVLGRCLYKYRIHEHDIYIPLSDYKNGIYFLRIINNGKTVTKKFVVSR
jgi:hypothetical protein